MSYGACALWAPMATPSSDVWTLIADLSDLSTACAIRLLQRDTISIETVRAAARRQAAHDRRLVAYMTGTSSDELDADIVHRRICARAIDWHTCIHAFKRDDVHYFVAARPVLGGGGASPRYVTRPAAELRIDDGTPTAGEAVMLVRCVDDVRLVRVTRHRGVWCDAMRAVERLSRRSHPQSVGCNSSAPTAIGSDDTCSSSSSLSSG